MQKDVRVKKSELGKAPRVKTKRGDRGDVDEFQFTQFSIPNSHRVCFSRSNQAQAESVLCAACLMFETPSLPPFVQVGNHAQRNATSHAREGEDSVSNSGGTLGILVIDSRYLRFHRGTSGRQVEKVCNGREPD